MRAAFVCKIITAGPAGSGLPSCRRGLSVVQDSRVPNARNTPAIAYHDPVRTMAHDEGAVIPRMATKVHTTMIDDLDGTEGDDVDTVKFGLDGTDYEIDLNPRNAKNLRESVLGTYLEHARRARGSHSGIHHPTPVRRRNRTGQSSRARKWLQLNGHPEVNDRGRIPADLLALVPDAVLDGIIPAETPNPMTMPAPDGAETPADADHATPDAETPADAAPDAAQSEPAPVPAPAAETPARRRAPRKTAKAKATA